MKRASSSLDKALEQIEALQSQLGEAEESSMKETAAQELANIQTLLGEARVSYAV